MFDFNSLSIIFLFFTIKLIAVLIPENEKFNMTLKYLKSQNINIDQLSLVGGVAANKFIYNKIEKECLKNNIDIILPPKNMLSDNAAMIGWACIKKLYNNNINDLYFKENPRLTLGR